jgi:flagellar biosynthesis/type III secretory pathway M-ring protein FliF/YscJ
MINLLLGVLAVLVAVTAIVMPHRMPRMGKLDTERAQEIQPRKSTQERDPEHLRQKMNG